MYNIPMKKRTSLKILIIIAAVLILFCLATYIATPLLIIRPSYNSEAAKELTLIEMEELYAEKRPLNIPLVEDITINTHLGKLTGWRLHEQGNTYTGESDLLLYFGGYNEDSSTAALRFLNQMTELDTYKGFDIAVIDWPGFGTSEGRATDNAIREASVAICNYFSSQENVRNIYLMGYSFGTGPAVYAASRCETEGLILLAPYESAFDLYNNVTPIFYGPLKVLIPFRMETGEYAEEVSEKTLLIASKTDSRVPYSSSLAIFERFENDCELLTLDDTEHGNLTTDPVVLNAISDYLNP